MTKHARHYSPAEADALLPWVAERLQRLRDAREKLGDEEARAALKEVWPHNGGGKPGRVVSEGFVELRAALSELQTFELVLRDLERGLVDFPTLRDGDEAYLCWIEGESEIAWWHTPDSGYDGRQPL